MSGLEGLLAGRTLMGRYRIEEVIGRGGFAAVYRAHDERLGRTVAVKVITVVAADAATRDQVRRRFEREARVAASLDHPNVVTVYDVGTDPDLELDFLVMELLRGEDLSRRLARPERLETPAAVRILRDTAHGIAAGHRGGLIHRDVKPANIFLAEQEREERFRVCVLDFGIARIRDAEQSLTKLTRGAAPLSPRYASPEQLQDVRDLSPASDVYSLGVIGYELLTGERPFDPEQIRLLTRGDPATPPSFDAIPEQVEPIIRRAMELDPERRFSDAGEMAEALDAALTSLRAEAAPAAAPPVVVPADTSDTVMLPAPEPVAAAPEVVVPPPVVPTPAAEPVREPAPLVDPTREVPLLAERMPAGVPVTGRPAGRSASPALLVGVPLLLLAGGGAWWALSRDTPDAPPPAEQTTAAAPPAATPPPARTPDSLAWSAPDGGDPAATGAAQQPGSGAAPAAGAAPGGGAAPPAQPGTTPTASGTFAGTSTLPRSPAPASSPAAASAARQAEQRFEVGDFPAAVAGFRRAVAAAPRNAHYRNQLGWALFQSGDLAGAERELRETVRLDPNRAIAYANLGEVYRVRGQTPAAIANYRRFLELNTNERREEIARGKLRGMGATP
ncbi:MAG TPA: serine/threonine-protein kinase [Longimicrobium sp.]|jgi:serine/threonine-protein kinase